MTGDGSHGVSKAAGPRVTLRRITRRDQDELTGLASASIAPHHRRIRLPATPAEFEAYVSRFDQPAAEGLLVCISENGATTRAARPPSCTSTAAGKITSGGPSPAR